MIRTCHCQHFPLSGIQQECIPAGCVPCWGVGVCLSACWDTPPGPGPPGVGLDNPLRCGPGHPPSQIPQPPPGSRPRPPQPDPQPPCLGLDTPKPDPPTSPLGLGLDATPRWTEFLTHASENITLPQRRCGRLKYYNKAMKTAPRSPMLRFLLHGKIPFSSIMTIQQKYVSGSIWGQVMFSLPSYFN